MVNIRCRYVGTLAIVQRTPRDKGIGYRLSLYVCYCDGNEKSSVSIKLNKFFSQYRLGDWISDDFTNKLLHRLSGLNQF